MTEDDLDPARCGLALLRVTAGGLFMLHGIDKLWGLPGIGGDSVALVSLLGLAAVIELAAGLLLAIGLATRIAALVASGEMAVAYWVVHAPASPFPMVNGGDAAILYCFIFLHLVAAGPGAFSLDGRLRRHRAPGVIPVRRTFL